MGEHDGDMSIVLGLAAGKLGDIELKQNRFWKKGFDLITEFPVQMV